VLKPIVRYPLSRFVDQPALAELEELMGKALHGHLIAGESGDSRLASP
jgi:hypothetical protein